MGLLYLYLLPYICFNITGNIASTRKRNNWKKCFV
jgi:hypothetical protein